eukprot:Clim_evm12s224 gene=Clim_evmTU12s224
MARKKSAPKKLAVLTDVDSSPEQSPVRIAELDPRRVSFQSPMNTVHYIMNSLSPFKRSQQPPQENGQTATEPIPEEEDDIDWQLEVYDEQKRVEEATILMPWTAIIIGSCLLYATGMSIALLVGGPGGPRAQMLINTFQSLAEDLIHDRMPGFDSSASPLSILSDSWVDDLVTGLDSLPHDPENPDTFESVRINELQGVLRRLSHGDPDLRDGPITTMVPVIHRWLRIDPVEELLDSVTVKQDAKSCSIQIQWLEEWMEWDRLRVRMERVLRQCPLSLFVLDLGDIYYTPTTDGKKFVAEIVEEVGALQALTGWHPILNSEGGALPSLEDATQKLTTKHSLVIAEVGIPTELLNEAGPKGIREAIYDSLNMGGHNIDPFLRRLNFKV